MGKNLKKLLLIYNPHAGKALIRSNLLDIIDVFVKAEYEVTVYPTQEQGDAINAAEERAGDYELVVCSGGDGTLDEVVTGIMKGGHKVPIGYVPAGSMNDFAKTLKLPRKMSKAAEVIIRGKLFPCDVGQFNDDYFVYIAAFGVFTNVPYETKQDLKNAIGGLAYLLKGVESLAVTPSHHIYIKADDVSIEDDFVFGMVTNSASVAGFKNIMGAHIEVDDGLFEATFIRTPKNPIEINAAVTALLAQDFDAEHIIHFKTSRLEIRTDDEISWTLDGEFGGVHMDVDIINRFKAINIIVP